jgi:hypothetical protein
MTVIEGMVSSHLRVRTRWGTSRFAVIGDRVELFWVSALRYCAGRALAEQCDILEGGRV